ncbi:MAG: hypothetical protein QM817_40910 [Archangium sp.]
MSFAVSAPRFSLPPGDFHLFSPAPDASATSRNQVPMCVLFRATTPWERRLGAPALDPVEAERAPWLGLLVLREDELTANTRFVEGQTVGACLQSAGAPTLALDPGEADLPCLALDIEAQLFAEIAPSLEEVRNLCHVRQVSTDDKELLGQDDDGWFSAAIANRVLAQATRHVVALVSWEGHGDRLAQLGASRPTFAVMFPAPTRLFVLQRWRCTGFDDAAKGAASFLQLAKRLSVGALGGPADASTTSVPARSTDDGFVLLSHDARDGRRLNTLYRGPLVPLMEKRVNGAPTHSAEQLIETVDHEQLTEKVDQVAYAAAFELGRVLALSDKYFALSLMRWRLGQYQGAVGGMLGSLLKPLLDPTQLQQLGKLLSFNAVSRTEMLSRGSTELLPGGAAFPSWSRFTGLPEGADMTALANEVAKLHGLPSGTGLLQTLSRGVVSVPSPSSPLRTFFDLNGGHP